MFKSQIAAVLHADWELKSNYSPTEQELKNKCALYGSRVWKNPKVSINEIQIPTIKSNEILIRVMACGICGSDYHLNKSDHSGYMLYPGLVKVPVVIGHELSGIVESIGSDVVGLKQGDPVVCEEMWWCGECRTCRAGFFNHCENIQEMGFTVDGGCQQFMKINQKYCWKIDTFKESLRSERKIFEAGSLVEPLCVSYNAMFIRSGGFKPGSIVVIWGCGPIGLGAIALAKTAGAGLIIAFEPSLKRAQAAKRIGADYVFNPFEIQNNGIEPWEKVNELSSGCGANLHVDTSADPVFVIPQTEKSSAIGGNIVIVGRADVITPIFFENYQVRSLQAFGSQGHSGSEIWSNIIRLISYGKIDLSSIITRKYKLYDINYAFNKLIDKEEIKITIEN
jgi:threonine dehydrogenase-like Zn-dependent dehydrogenase